MSVRECPWVDCSAGVNGICVPFGSSEAPGKENLHANGRQIQIFIQMPACLVALKCWTNVTLFVAGQLLTFWFSDKNLIHLKWIDLISTVRLKRGNRPIIWISTTKTFGGNGSAIKCGKRVASAFYQFSFNSIKPEINFKRIKFSPEQFFFGNEWAVLFIELFLRFSCSEREMKDKRVWHSSRGSRSRRFGKWNEWNKRLFRSIYGPFAASSDTVLI